MKTGKQLKFERTSGWGGKRRSAGRKNNSKTVNHMKRELVSTRTPLHLTMKMRERLPSLRSRLLFREFKRAVVAARKYGLYVIHFSVQYNHIHMICESEANVRLGSGMRSLAGRFSRAVRRKYFYRIKGSVFKGRYHLSVVKSAREMKHVLRYVLLNHHKHVGGRLEKDPYSSASVFQQWGELLGSKASCSKIRAEFDCQNELLEVLSLPRSWMARVGWRRAA